MSWHKSNLEKVKLKHLTHAMELIRVPAAPGVKGLTMLDAEVDCLKSSGGEGLVAQWEVDFQRDSPQGLTG